MELRKNTPPVVSEEQRKAKEELKHQKQEAAKSIGEFLISMTNICFDRCIDTNKIQLSSIESSCINNCFLNYNKFNLIAYEKFYDLHFSKSTERADDYGDYFELLERKQKH